jgi:hypothetical protein
LEFLLNEDHLPPLVRDEMSNKAHAFRKYLNQFRGIETVAMHWSHSISIDHGDREMKWVRHLPSLRNLSIILDSGARKVRKANPLRFVPLQPESHQEISGMAIMWFMHKYLEAFRSKFPAHSIPQLEARQV